MRFPAEMGGKNASVVLADADLEAAAAVAAAFGQAGQRCTGDSRMDAWRHEVFGYARTIGFRYG